MAENVEISSSNLGKSENNSIWIKGGRLENGNYPTLSVLSLTGDFVPLSANP